MKPLRNDVLLEPLIKPTQSAGGIALPEQYRDDQKQFLVLAVGPGRKLKNGELLPPDVKPGDKVLVDTFGQGTRHRFEDGRVLVDARFILMVWA